MTQIRLKFHNNAGGGFSNSGDSQNYPVSGADANNGARGRRVTGSGGSPLLGGGLDDVGVSAVGVGRRIANGDIPEEISWL